MNAQHFAPLSEDIQWSKWVKRLKSKLKKDPATGCHLWTGSVCTKGYGQINLGDEGRWMAHRFAWLVAHSHPGSMKVLHRCDTPRCCNPKHLFLGTTADNNRDRKEKGRNAPMGEEDNPNAHLTRDQARSIFVDNRSTSTLARLYGVSRPCISAIKTRKYWKNATADLVRAPASP